MDYERAGLMEIEVVRAKLEDFLANHPECTLTFKEHYIEGQSSVQEAAITLPWNDKTLQISVPQDGAEAAELFESLNSVLLPTKYSAVFHRANNTLEVIWTAFKLSPVLEEVSSRGFTFNFDGKAHWCCFGEATPCLITIARSTSPVAMANHTNYRNITSLVAYANNFGGGHGVDKPLSFFVDCADLGINEIDDMIKHLNAHMLYYDTRTPFILIHEDTPSDDHKPRDRYLHGAFPDRIDGRRIDLNVLEFWLEMTKTKNEIMRYLLCYRIIEYVAFGYIDIDARAKVRKILNSPHSRARPEETLSSVVQIITTAKASDEIQKAQHLVTSTVNLVDIWREICRNKSKFVNPTSFEGGYEVKALISEKDTLETFSTNGVRNTMDRLRAIRNALSHGRDTQTRGVIRPTQTNSMLIKPWLNLIEIIAGETMLCDDL